MMDENQEFQLIDVREDYEFDAANLNGLLIPLATIVTEKDKVRTDIPVIIHCKAGSRSAVAVNVLESQFGFTNLHNLKGGILAYASEIDPSLSPI
jgi:rhodanese-related sulfurtransferase